MDPVVITQKLESLRRSISRINEKCPSTPQLLESDYDLQDILAFNLTRSVQLSVDIASHIISESSEPAPTTMGSTFETLEKLGVIDKDTCSNLKSPVGFRNIAVHNYEIIDWKIVHSICTKQLDDFVLFAKCVARFAKL